MSDLQLEAAQGRISELLKMATSFPDPSVFSPKKDGERWFVEGEPVWYERRLSPEFKEVWIVPISDVHFGDPLFSYKHFLRTLEYIKSIPNVYTILNGDLCNTIIASSVGNIYKQINSPGDQRDWMIEQLMPIKDKVLGMTTGNHEERIKELDISWDIARALNVPYRPSGILLKILLGDNYEGHKGVPYSYWGYVTHGYGGARTKGGKSAKLERISTYIDADFYVMAHDHEVNVAPSIYLEHSPKGKLNTKTGFITGRVIAKRKMLIKSNAYLKWGDYGEMKGFAPTDLNTPIIKLFADGRHRVNVEV